MTSSSPFYALSLFVFGFVLLGCTESVQISESVTEDSIAAAAPGTEIFLAPLDTSGGELQVGALEQMTDRPGYDNQPAFTLDGTAVIWSSVRGGQADLYRRPVTDTTGEENAVTRLTHTLTSEFSPTPQAEGGMSVLRVEADGRQRLWHYTGQGAPVDPILPEADSVGYYAWLGQSKVALYLLGSPPELYVANLAVGRRDTSMASNIGRSLQSVPNRSAVSFIQIDDDSTTAVHLLDGMSLETRHLTDTPGDGTGDHHAWTPGGTLLMASEGTLQAWSPDEDEWTEVKSLDTLDVSRLAVSPTADRLALVAAE